jgi:UDP-glucose 4-epimerase
MTTSNNVLITGGHGFLGRNTAHYFKSKGFHVYGIGRGSFSSSEKSAAGFTRWLESNITAETLSSFQISFDYIVHCAGGASVAKSFEDPEKDYFDTVSATTELLEYVRRFSSNSRLIYPSSAAVYGEHGKVQLKTSTRPQPSSPYGVNKKAAEDKCIYYRDTYNIDVVIIRFFSIYGPGLKKQLIWDAMNKFHSQDGEIEFWGTGLETRDWLYIDDAVSLIYALCNDTTPPPIINGATGTSAAIKEVLSILGSLFSIPSGQINFIGDNKAGDPSHYLADVTEADSLNWNPAVSLKEGLQQCYNSFIHSVHD